MNRNIFILVVTLFFSIPVFSQTEAVKVERSENKVIIDGKIYYVHIVKPGETKYSLSKAYNVTEKELTEENPDIIFGLQAGQALKIPFVPEAEKPKAYTTNTTEYIYHTIEQGQTLYYLSKTYNVSKESILNANPGIDYSSMKIGQVVKIPKAGYTVERLTITTDPDYIYHRIEPKETFYSLSKKYNTSIRQIKKANRDLEGELKYGQYIRIPITGIDTLESVLLDQSTSDIDSMKILLEMQSYKKRPFEECDSVRYANDGRKYNVGLLLPFFLDENTFNVDTVTRDTIYIDPFGEMQKKRIEQGIFDKSYNYLEFYEGAMIAVDSLRKTGFPMDIYVYDAGKDTSKVKELMKSEEFNSLDMIIGRISKEIIMLLSKHFGNTSVSIVSPIPPEANLLKGNPNLFQVNPSLSQQLESFARFTAHYYDKNIVFVHQEDSLKNEMMEEFKQKLFDHFSYYQPIDQISFKEVVYLDSLNFLEQAMTPGTENIVIVASENNPFVSDVITGLNTLIAQNYNITLLGFPKWLRFENIDPDYFFNLNVHLFTTYFVDYDNPQVKIFLKKYRDKYKMEPSVYSFQGYDMTFYFLTALKNYGTSFKGCLYNLNGELLQSDFRFEQKEDGTGFENTAVSVITYDKGYQIHKVQIPDKSLSPSKEATNVIKYGY